MSKITRIALASLALLLISALVVGCSRSTVKIGWRELSGLKRKRANYARFDGVASKAFRAPDVALCQSCAERDGESTL